MQGPALCAAATLLADGSPWMGRRSASCEGKVSHIGCMCFLCGLRGLRSSRFGSRTYVAVYVDIQRLHLSCGIKNKVKAVHGVKTKVKPRIAGPAQPERKLPEVLRPVVHAYGQVGMQSANHFCCPIQYFVFKSFHIHFYVRRAIAHEFIALHAFDPTR